MFTLTGNGKTFLFAPSAISYGEQSNRSYLKLVKAGETYEVAEFNSGMTGKSFRFPVSKSGANEKGGKATAVAVTGTNRK